jgi:hypothetical protein
VFSTACSLLTTTSPTSPALLSQHANSSAIKKFIFKNKQKTNKEPNDAPYMLLVPPYPAEVRVELGSVLSEITLLRVPPNPVEVWVSVLLELELDLPLLRVRPYPVEM